MALTIKDLEQAVALAAMPDGQGYAYVETGRYKPFMPATVEAARRRGYRVERRSRSAFFVYPKPAAVQS